MSPKSGLRIFYSYIAADDPEAAERTITNIYDKAQLLTSHPGLGYKYEPESNREIRILLYEHYRITYLVKPDGNIDILGVFHGSLDMDRYFL